MRYAIMQCSLHLNSLFAIRSSNYNYRFEKCDRKFSNKVLPLKSKCILLWTAYELQESYHQILTGGGNFIPVTIMHDLLCQKFVFAMHFCISSIKFTELQQAVVQYCLAALRHDSSLFSLTLTPWLPLFLYSCPPVEHTLSNMSSRPSPLP